MRNLGLLGVAIALAGTGAIAASQAEVPRKPTDKWVVEFDDAQCLARRDYGTTREPLHLVLKQPLLGDVLQVAIVRQKYARAPEEHDGKIQFDDARPIAVSVLEFQPHDTELRTNLINLPVSQFAAARSAKALRVVTKGLDVTLALSDVAPLMRVMEQCVIDLRQAWTPVNKSRSAQGNLQKIFEPGDYPMNALFSGKSGRVEVVLLIDERGRIADCSVVGTSGVAALDAQTCALLTKRAKLIPAQDTSGKPTRDVFTTSIGWIVETM
jgi:TonB family protein